MNISSCFGFYLALILLKRLTECDTFLIFEILRHKLRHLDHSQIGFYNKLMCKILFQKGLIGCDIFLILEFSRHKL